MVGPTNPRTATLFRTYYGLLAVSIVLSGVLIVRPLASMQAAPLEVVKPAPHDAKAHRANLASHPTAGINWGGQKLTARP